MDREVWHAALGIKKCTKFSDDPLNNNEHKDNFLMYL